MMCKSSLVTVGGKGISSASGFCSCRCVECGLYSFVVGDVKVKCGYVYCYEGDVWGECDTV